MSLTANLHDDWCRCPSCGELIDYVSVSSDFIQNVEGFPEYLVKCPICGQSFYASGAY